MSKEPITTTITGEFELPEGEYESDVPSRFQEVFGVLTALIALFLLLSLVSYDGLDSTGAPISGGNIVGLAGEWTSFALFSLLGATSYLLDAFLWFASVCLFIPAIGSIRKTNILGALLLSMLATITIHTMFRDSPVLGGHPAGGFVGQLLGEVLLSLLSTAGTYLVTIGSMVLVLLLVTDVSVAVATRSLVRGFRFSCQKSYQYLSRIIKAWQEENEEADLEASQSKRLAEISPAPTTEKPKKKRPKLSAVDSIPVEKEEQNEDSDSQILEPKIVKKKISKKASSADPDDIIIDSGPVRGQFQTPPLSMLQSPPEESVMTDVDDAFLKKMADRLTGILADFNVQGEVREIHPGPVVTMFEFQPKSGTKLSKIESLSSEIAMALEVLRVRVVAPIPGKNAVGFELPNESRETVYLKEMLSDPGFQNNKKSKLPMALGKDIGGQPQFVDLAKMPHLLIAGTTGSGKSVSLNAMLISLLYKYTPDDLRLLLVDPKMVELGIYDNIPHLLLPVVSDMSKACLALKWAVDEMERRYQLFADLGVRNLESYNNKIAKLKSDHSALSDEEKTKIARENTAMGIDENEEVVVVAKAADTPDKLEKMPFIVIVVDELADLMMVAAKDVETSIARLAQKARAAGLHLIIATQRPSVDVITGLIKANFPSRISFRVSSNHDSRTILGCNGAENLLGMGDMLVVPPGTSDLKRVHGAFVEDDEINQVVSFLRAQDTPKYDEEILKPRDDEQASAIEDEERDEVYDQAVNIVAESQSCSISMIQRRLRIGYNRSARIVEMMEREGVVGPANGVNKREILISPQ